MKGKKSTRSAFLTSLTSLVLCFAMLLGTTFAWFTDTASTGVNKIQAGTLDIQLLDKDGNSLENRSLAFDKAEGGNGQEVLWEPGCTYYTQGFRIKNNGTLNLKFKIVVNGITGGNAELLRAIDFYLTTTKDNDLRGATPLSSFTSKEFKLAPGMFWQGTDDTAAIGAVDEETVYLVGHMKETAGNEFQGKYIDGVGITLYATQVPAEFDSFSSDYDDGATWPIEIVQPVEQQAMTAVKDADNNVTEYTYINSAATVKATVPFGAVAEGKTPKITVKPDAVPDTVNTTITASGKDAIAYDISVSNLVDSNTELVEVSVYVGKNLEGVVVYHEGTAMNVSDYIYNASTGFVTIKTTSFSPFTIAYDAPTLNQDADGNFTIGSANELMFFAKDVNEKGNTYAGKTVKLTANIDLAGRTWTPVGINADGANKFKGTFDGNSKTISNFDINTADDVKYQATGFFGALNGTAKNFTIDGATITGMSAPNVEGNTDNGIAVVAGSIYTSGSIEGVTVKNSTVSGNRYVGGISGYTYGSVKGCAVENVQLTATPDKLTGSWDNGDKVGGIVGAFWNENTYEISGNTAKNVTITGYRDMGGIVGFANGNVQNNTVNGLTLIQDYSILTTPRTTVEAIIGRHDNFGVDSSNTATNVKISKSIFKYDFSDVSQANYFCPDCYRESAEPANCEHGPYLNIVDGTAQVLKTGAWLAMKDLDWESTYLLEYDVDVSALADGAFVAFDAGEQTKWQDVHLGVKNENGTFIAYNTLFVDKLNDSSKLGEVNAKFHVAYTFKGTDSGITMNMVISDGTHSYTVEKTSAATEPDLCWDVYTTAGERSVYAALDNMTFTMQKSMA